MNRRSTIYTIAVRLGRWPALKRFLKFFYQVFMFILNFHRQKALTRFHLQKVSGVNGGFFGYYDKSPESPDGTYVVYHEFTGSEKDKVQIILAACDGTYRQPVGETYAFNLQIGSRLQWIDNSSFIYNTFEDGTGECRCVVYSLPAGTIKSYPFHIYDVHNDWYLSLDFLHLTAIGSEYGYRVRPGEIISDNPVITAGRFGEDKACIVGLSQMRTYLPEAFLPGTVKHHFNHLMFSPDASSFIFIFRYSDGSGKKDALFHYHIEQRKLVCISREMTSHLCWAGNDTIFGYLVHKGIPGYYFIKLGTLTFNKLETGRNESDGHPTFRNGVVLTDTYPDHSRMQEIILISDSKALTAGRFYGPLIYHEKNRCDLHPRFNYKGNTIYFDSMHEGRRHLYKLTL